MKSKRAAIFKEILPYINSDDWERVDQFIVFGKRAFDAYVEEGVGDDPPGSESVRRILHETKMAEGQDALLPRTSFRASPPDGTPRAIQQLVEDLIKAGVTEAQLAQFVAESSRRGGKKPKSEPGTDDAIDAALAAKLVKDLETASPVATVFDKVTFDPKSYHLAKPFEEAHLCNMAGLSFATAILCRAVLEESLKSIIDPNEVIKNGLKPKEPYITRMLEEAEKRGLLTKDRVHYGEEIRIAGNDAVHEPPKFQKRYPKGSDDLIYRMRMVVNDLHQPQSARS